VELLLISLNDSNLQILNTFDREIGREKERGRKKEERTRGRERVRENERER